MSSVGFQWVLKLLRDAGYQVERAFLPDDVDAWKKDRVPLYTYETERPVGHFPTIGVSLAYELELAGLIEALKLAGIPPLRRDRGPEHPRIVMGGPLTFSNPLPAAPFVDAMIMGEAEDVLLPAFEAAVHTEGPHGWTRSRPSRAGTYRTSTASSCPPSPRPPTRACPPSLPSWRQMPSCPTCSSSRESADVIACARSV